MVCFLLSLFYKRECICFKIMLPSSTTIQWVSSQNIQIKILTMLISLAVLCSCLSLCCNFLLCPLWVFNFCPFGLWDISWTQETCSASSLCLCWSLILRTHSPKTKMIRCSFNSGFYSNKHFLKDVFPVNLEKHS